ncbi:MAG: type II pantothenate kinase [Eubacteriaceae bacterium]|nr:type II pantothenate kinase [Eubacteriaceae bacterium]
MKIVLGVDVGGSTTKIVGFSSGTDLIGTLQVRAADQITSMYGAIGHFLRQYSYSLNDVSKIILTGVGASFIDEDVYSIPTHKIEEFQAIGFGGLYTSGKKSAFVASMGTGTAFVRAAQDEIVHIGGSGVGGGTLLGLSSILLNTSDTDAIIALAAHGHLENVDLAVGDILGHDIPSLPANLTASNFGKVKSTATESDFAVGIINMIFQTIGMMAVFAARNDSIKEVILTGSLATLPQAEEVFSGIGGMHALNFTIPDNAVFATAIGAAVSVMQNL